MPGVWQRHPRYSVFIFLILLVTFYLLSPYKEQTLHFSSRLLADRGLVGRLARSNRIYEKTLKDRQSLIEKFGPTPSDVAT